MYTPTMRMGEIHERKITRMRAVLEMRKQGMTYDAIAAELGVTRERIRQIEAQARRPRPIGLSSSGT